MLNSRKNMVDMIPTAEVKAAIDIATLLWCWITRLGMYPPVTINDQVYISL